MSKAILIIDMPKDCYECPLEYHRKCLGIVVCEKVESLDRPKWCPLKPLPKKEPIRYGHWIEHHEPYTWMGYSYWSCSECGYECGYEKDIRFRTNYCPHCGAKMEKENEQNKENISQTD